MRRLARSVRRSLGRRGAPRVTVVLHVPDGAAFLDESLAGIRAAEGVRTEVVRVPEGGSVDDAVAAATGDLLAFLDADHSLLPTGLADLAADLGDTAPMVAGKREIRRGARVLSTPPPGSPVDLALAGKLFRTAFVRDTPVRFGSWAGQEGAVATLVRAAGTQVVLSEALLGVEWERDLAAPIDRQRRFRADLAVARFGALAGVLASVAPADVGAWCAAAARDVLPLAGLDAVGGGPAYLTALQPFAAVVVDGLPEGRPDEVPVAARLVAWATAHGSLDDLALALDHLTDHPHGLPFAAGQATGPEGLSIEVPREWLRIGAADRTLHARVVGLEPTGPGRALLRGNAFVAYDEEHDLPTVTLAGSPVAVRRRADPTANEWAERGHEDHGGSGFEGEVTLTGSSRGRPVRVELGGQLVDLGVWAPAEGDTGPAIEDATLLPDGLRLAGAGAPARIRLVGPRGTTPWAEPAVVDGRAEALLPLTTGTPWGETALPGGRYRFEPAGWSWPSRPEPAELVDDRVGVRPDAGGARIGPPLTSHDRSAFAQQQRVSGFSAPRPRARQQVLLESFHGRVVADNPAAIGRELAARDRGLDLVWVVDDPAVDVPAGTRAAPRRTQRWYDALAGAHAYVANAAAPPWFHKPDGQLHVQTWHGTPLKRIGEDRGPGDFNTWRHRRHVAGQAARWDGLVSPSPYCSEIFRSAFRYDGPLLEIGYPRNDVLVSDRAPLVRAETRRRLGLTDSDRVLLYAPTWREYVGVRDSKPLFLDPVRVLAAQPDAVVLVRGHYNASRQADVFTDRQRIIDVTRYPDIADLYLAADSLVTDYSSVMFDFALTDKPIVLLTPDLDQYRDVERGFYFDIEADAPGPMVTSTDEVVERLGASDEHAVARAAFRERFCPWDDGHASARAVDLLLGGWD